MRRSVTDSPSLSSLCLLTIVALASACDDTAEAGPTKDSGRQADDDSVGTDDEDDTSDDADDNGAGKTDAGSTKPTAKPDASKPLDSGGPRLTDARVGTPTETADGATPPTTEPGNDAGGPTDAPSFGASTVVPHESWTCGMPEGIPSPEGAPVVFTAEFQVTNIREVGTTQFGKRQLVELGTGSFTGDKLKATLEKGGTDQPLVLSNGAVELEEILMLKTSDNKYIYLRVCGTAPSADQPVRVVMDFEAPNSSSYAFLNKAKLVGTRTLDATAKTIKLSVHDVAAVAAGEPKVTVENPDGVEDQTWECRTGTAGTAGTEIYTEVVNIGSSQSVGASKNGNRNVIPITGGTARGRLKGKVLPGGADFQILDNGFELDARYTMMSDDNELILVRNCGPASGLIPIFEARSDGPYAFLNENDWVSSSPQIGLGTVTLVISEKR